jgi:hypothetical protein
MGAGSLKRDGRGARRRRRLTVPRERAGRVCGRTERPKGRVLPGGGQPAVEAVAPNDEVTGAIPQNGERRTGAKPGVIMCIIGDLLSCVWTRRETLAPA